MLMWLTAFKNSKDADSAVFDDLCPVQLAWSADGETLYIPVSNEEEAGPVIAVKKGTWTASDMQDIDVDMPYQISVSPNGLYFAVIDEKKVLIYSFANASKAVATLKTSHLINSVSGATMKTLYLLLTCLVH